MLVSTSCLLSRSDKLVILKDDGEIVDPKASNAFKLTYTRSTSPQKNLTTLEV